MRALSVSSRVRRRGSRPDDGEGVLHEFGDVAARELVGGEVDADTDVPGGPLAGPARRLLAGVVEDPRAEFDDDARFFGDRNELRGRHEPVSGAFPAHECFEAGDGAGLGRDDRLVVDAQFVARNACAQVVLQFAAGGDVVAKVVSEHFEAGPSFLLRPVEREVRVLQQCFPALGTGFGERDPDTDGVTLAARLDVLRAGPGVVENALRDFGGVLDVREVFADEDELVSTDPSDRVRFASDCLKGSCGCDEEIVAGRVPVGVVDMLEVIEVEVEDCECAGASPDAGEGAVELYRQQRAVGQAGERIVEPLPHLEVRESTGPM